MANKFEQEVILDADGQPIFAALKQVREQIAGIQKLVADTAKLANKGVADYGNILTTQTKEIQQSLSQIRAIAAGKNAPGLNIQSLNANRRLAKATTDATEYGRGLASAATAADALRAKLNGLNKEIAARGALDKGETLKQTQMRRNFEEQIKQLRQLDAEMDKVQRKAGRTALGGSDLTGARAASDALAKARARLQEAALDPSRVNIQRELTAYRTSLDNFDSYLSSIRTKQMQRIQDDRAYGRAAEQAESRLAATRAKGFEEQKKTDEGEAASERRKTQQMEAMWREQEKANGQAALQVQTAENQKLKYLNDGSEAIRKQTMSWHALTDAELQHAERVAQLYNGRGFVNGKTTERVMAQRASTPINSSAQRTLFQGQLAGAAGGIRDMVNSGQVSPDTALLGTRFEQQQRQKQLQDALTSGEAEQVRLATQNLQIADAKVRAAERLVREEQQQLDIERRLNTTTSTEQQRAQVALAHSYAREQIQTLGSVEAIRRAKEATVLAEEKLVTLTRTGTIEEIKQARAAVELARAKQGAVEREGRNPLSSILSSGYGLAAFARTSVYGAAAAAAYGLFNTLQTGLTNVVDMEDELAKLGAIADASASQMSQLRGAIFDVAATSRYSTVDLIKISQTLAQAGVSASQMTEVLKSVTTLANASGSTPDEAVNLVTSALGAFQLQASESARVADLMTSALNRTKLTVAQTGQAIQYVGSTAFEQNVGLEQLLATVGAIAQAGVKSGSTIGTGFRQFLVDLQTPSEKLTEQLEKLGLTQKDVDVSTRGLSAVLDTLSKSGFGSAQAYEGLETRAAAFYLTAKNNVDIIDQLQLAFANQGAAALANERAMESLSAQWQRFKNIIGDQFAEQSLSFFSLLQKAIRGTSDLLEDFYASQEAAQKRLSSGDYGNMGWLQKISTYISDDLTTGRTATALNPFAGGLLGKYIRDYSDAADEAAGKSGQLADAISNSSQKISDQGGVIGELQKEYVRLLTQKDSLINNDQRSSAEMTNLMSRFQGLSGYLTNTKNLYVDLTNAVQGFIAANQKALATDIAAQQSNLAQQNAGLRSARPGLISAVTGNAGYNALDARTKAAIQDVRTNTPGSDAYLRATATLADAATRLAGSSTGIDKALNSLAQNMRSATSNVSTFRLLSSQRSNAEAASTVPGQVISSNLAKIEAMVQAGGSDAGKLTDADKLIASTKTYIGSFKTLPQHEKFVSDALADLTSLANQIKALRTPSKADQREADRQERLVSQSDLDNTLRTFGLTFSRGHDESAAARARQDDMHRRGLTPATADTSAHTARGGIARDLSVRGLTDAEAKQMASAIEVKLKQAGINAFVQFETGRGSNQGTGRHIHVGVRPGTRKANGSAASSETKLDQFIDQKQLQLDQDALAIELKNMAKATTTETFSAAAEAARGALERVNQDLKNQAANELAAKGVLKTDPEWAVRMRQVSDQIEQNIASFNQKVADALIKNLDLMVKAAQQAFDAAVSPAQQTQAITEARASGLGYNSVANRVPDYVKTLAEQDSARAAENTDRAKQAALPAQIAAQAAAIEAARASLASLPQYDANGEESAAWQKTTQEIQAQVLALQQLQTTKASLDAALSASSQIPLTLADGLQQAISAYEQTHTLSNTFKQDLIMNMGGAVEQLHTGLTSFFNDVLTGSKSLLGAFGDLITGMMKYLQQLAIQYVANQAFRAIIGLIGSVGGGLAGSGGSNGTDFSSAGSYDFSSFALYDGGSPALIEKGYDTGGKVTNGSSAMDSVRARLAKNEWVVNSDSAASVGDGFMASLNAHGAKALDAVRGDTQVIQAPKQETNVYVVAPEQKPQMGKNDVLVVLQDDLLNGESRKLVQSISQGA